MTRQKAPISRGRTVNLHVLPHYLLNPSFFKGFTPGRAHSLESTPSGVIIYRLGGLAALCDIEFSN